MIHQIPKQVWDDLQENVRSLTTRVTTIEHQQKRQGDLLKAALAIIPAVTAALLSIIQAIKG